MAEFLTSQYGFATIHLLIDSDANAANVSAALREVMAGAEPQDRVVFYFSGHGSTALRGGRFEECLMLHDGAFFDDHLVSLSQSAPACVLTVVVDACFSGGVGKLLLAEQRSGGLVIDRARVKAFTRITPADFAAHADQQEDALVVKGFGRAFRPALPDPRLAALFSASTCAPADVVGPIELNGMLVLACREGEVTAAATALTKGRSAFTFALLEILSQTGPLLSASALIAAVQGKMWRMGFAQTPVLIPPAGATEIADRAFISLASIPPSIQMADGSIFSLNCSMEELLMSFVNAVAAALVDQLRQQQRDDQNVMGSLVAALNRNAQWGQRQGNGNDALLAQAIGNALANRNNQQNQNDGLAQAVANALFNSCSRSNQPNQNDVLAQAIGNALANRNNQNDSLANLISGNRNPQQGQNDALAQAISNALANRTNQQGQNDVLAQAISNALANRNNQPNQNDILASLINSNRSNQPNQNDILSQAVGNALVNAVNRNAQQGQFGAGAEGSLASVA